MKTHRLLALVPAFCGASATAQFTELNNVTTCDGGGAIFTQHFEAAPDSPRAAQANFQGLPASDPSSMFSHACFWRAPSIHDRMHQFYNDPTDLASQGGVSALFGFGQWTVTWPQVMDTPYFSAQWTQEIHCRGAENQIVVNTWELTNPSGSPVPIEFLAYVDIDLGDYETNATGPASPSRQIVEETPFVVGGPCFEFFGAGFDNANNAYSLPPDSWEIDWFPNIERNLTSAEFTPLSNTGLPFGADDFTGAMSWNILLIPGVTTKIRYAFGRNTNYCDSLGSVAHYPPTPVFPNTTLNAGAHPWPGIDFTIDLSSTPSAPTALMLGLTSLEIPIPACPTTHTLLVDPNILSGLPIVLDAAGQGQLTLPGACHPFFYCGTPLHFQLWAITSNPSICAGLPQLEHSRRLTVTYGSM